MLAQDAHDGRLAHADAHAPELLADSALAPRRVLALQGHDELDDGLVERRATTRLKTPSQRLEARRPAHDRRPGRRQGVALERLVTAGEQVREDLRRPEPKQDA